MDNVGIAELGYLAGIVDGEGVIGFYEIHQKGRLKPTYQTHVRIINSHPDIITKCDAIIEALIGHTTVHGRDLRKDRNHIYWYTSVNHQVDVIKMLSAIEPYLAGKKSQAHLIIDLLKKHKRGTSMTGVEKEAVAILKMMKREKMTPTNGNAEPNLNPDRIRKCVENIKATTQKRMFDLS